RHVGRHHAGRIRRVARRRGARRGARRLAPSNRAFFPEPPADRHRETSREDQGGGECERGGGRELDRNERRRVDRERDREGESEASELWTVVAKLTALVGVPADDWSLRELVAALDAKRRDYWRHKS